MDDVHFISLCFSTMEGDPVVMLTIIAQEAALNFNVQIVNSSY